MIDSLEGHISHRNLKNLKAKTKIAVKGANLHLQRCIILAKTSASGIGFGQTTIPAELVLFCARISLYLMRSFQSKTKKERAINRASYRRDGRCGTKAIVQFGFFGISNFSES